MENAEITDVKIFPETYTVKIAYTLEIAKEALELYVPTRGQRKRKVPPWMTKKRYCDLGSTTVLWKKYHNSESYYDLCEYKRVLNRATSEYKKAKYSFEKKTSK